MKNQANMNEEWTTIIRSNNKWINFNFKEILHYKDLIFLFVRRDFVAYYQQALLGPLWYILQPLMSTIVFTIVFGNIAKIPTDDIPRPIFYLAGLIIWNHFSNCLVSTSSVFTGNAGIFGKVYFPRLTVPISQIISNFIKFEIQFLLFFGFFIFFIIANSSLKPNLFIFTVPLILVQVSLLGFGCGILISSLTTKYRDLNFLIGFGMQLWMYATPIVYPISQVPENWRWVFMINPMSSMVEIFRYAFLGSGYINIFNLIVSVIITMVFIVLGLILFGRVEKSFMDRV